jgi:hypothetical protein
MTEKTKRPKIDCYIIEGCGSEPGLRAVIEEVRKRYPVEIEVNFHTLTTEQAIKLNITGSPAVFINGRDIAPGTSGAGGS